MLLYHLEFFDYRYCRYYMLLSFIIITDIVVLLSCKQTCSLTVTIATSNYYLLGGLPLGRRVRGGVH